jgi:hypothetical protein
MLRGFLLEADVSKTFQSRAVRDVSFWGSSGTGIVVDQDTGEVMCGKETGERGSSGPAADDQECCFYHAVLFRGLS